MPPRAIVALPVRRSTSTQHCPKRRATTSGCALGCGLDSLSTSWTESRRNRSQPPPNSPTAAGPMQFRSARRSPKASKKTSPFQFIVYFFLTGNQDTIEKLGKINRNIDKAFFSSKKMKQSFTSIPPHSVTYGVDSQ